MQKYNMHHQVLLIFEFMKRYNDDDLLSFYLLYCSSLVTLQAILRNYALCFKLIRINLSVN